MAFTGDKYKKYTLDQLSRDAQKLALRGMNMKDYTA